MSILKKLTRKLPFLSSPKKAFYAKVRCSDCGEEITIRINRSSDFQVEYGKEHDKCAYMVKKEIVGKDCYNIMRLTIALTEGAKVLFADTKDCKFIDFGKED